jgi:hypothetical protein
MDQGKEIVNGRTKAESTLTHLGKRGEKFEAV